MNTKKADMLFPVSENVLSSYTGEKLYEMTNHLGNVLTVINDIKVPYQNGTDILYYATITNTSDYSPFGVTLDTDGGRTQYLNPNSKYRYQFNGMEGDDEPKGDGNSYTTEFRQYDPRLGRWLSLDPLMAQFPHTSPYAAFANNPIFYVDPYGLAPTNGDPEFDPKTYRGVITKEVEITPISYKLARFSIYADLSVLEKQYKEMEKLRNEQPAREPSTFWVDSKRFAEGPTQKDLDGMVAGDVFRVTMWDPYRVLMELFPDYEEYEYLGNGQFVKIKDFNQVARNKMLVDGALMIIPIGRVFKFVGSGVKLVVPTAKVVEGVYYLGTTLGKYVGQSKNIMTRVLSHFSKGGKLSQAELQTSVFYSMPGSTLLQREVYEQYLILKYGKSNLLNHRNPMGGRMELYYSMIDDVIKQFGLPK